MIQKLICKKCGCNIEYTLDKQNQRYWFHNSDSVFLHRAEPEESGK